MQNNQATLIVLRRRWWGLLLFYVGILWLGYQGLRLVWPEAPATQWAVQTAVVLAYSLWECWTGLDRNHRPGESSLLPAFGPGNMLTLARGLVMALLAGFLFLPRPMDGLLAWTPAILYTVLATLDYLDGTVARVTNQATVLGERLDGAFDALGLLIAVGLAVWYGQLPVWYLLVGLSRYLFSWGIWWRERQGKPLYELPPSRNRRLLAGFQMGFISVILWPLFSPPGTTLAGVLFAAPLLAGFGRDWLVVSGRLAPDFPAYGVTRQRLLQVTTGWLPPVLRAVVTLVSIQFLWPIAFDESLRRTLFGLAGRAVAQSLGGPVGGAGRAGDVDGGAGSLGSAGGPGATGPHGDDGGGRGPELAKRGIGRRYGGPDAVGQRLLFTVAAGERLVRIRAGEKRDS